MTALLFAFVCGWFIVLIYQLMGGSLTTPKSQLVRHDDSKYLQRLRTDIEAAVLAGTLFVDSSDTYSRSVAPVTEAIASLAEDSVRCPAGFVSSFARSA
jgi:hypothetical protein